MNKLKNEIEIDGIIYVKKEKKNEYSEYEYLDGDGKWEKAETLVAEDYLLGLIKINYNWGGKYEYYMSKTKYNYDVILRKKVKE